VPIFEYVCPNCNWAIERIELQGREYSKPDCVCCGADMERIISPFATVTWADPPVKLTGWRDSKWPGFGEGK